MESREVLLARLNETLAQFLAEIEHLPDPNLPVYDGWSAKDIVGHITFWHESFARNVRDLALEVKPTPLKGRLIDLNQGGVDDMRQYSLAEVVARLTAAHRTIQEHILDPKLTWIPYRKGSRDYMPEEHLEIVQGHIQQHLFALQKRTAQAVKPR